MKKLIISGLLALSIPFLFVNDLTGVKAINNVPSAGDLQTAIDSAAASTYKKTTSIASGYTLDSDYPFTDKNPLNTNYTQDGLYMIERKSGYFTYQNSIYRAIVDNEGTASYSLFNSNYHNYYSFYRTLKDFTGTYVSGHLEVDSSDVSGFTFKNIASSYSDSDIRSMIYFVAPLVSVADGAVFSNYAFSFKLTGSTGNYSLSEIDISLTITVGEQSSALSSQATFSNIGSTELGYSLPA